MHTRQALRCWALGVYHKPCAFCWGPVHFLPLDLGLLPLPPFSPPCWKQNSLPSLAFLRHGSRGGKAA